MLGTPAQCFSELMIRCGYFNINTVPVYNSGGENSSPSILCISLSISGNNQAKPLSVLTQLAQCKHQ